VRDPCSPSLDTMLRTDTRLTLNWFGVSLLLPLDVARSEHQVYLRCWEKLMACVDAHAAPLSLLVTPKRRCTFVYDRYAPDGRLVKEQLTEFITLATGAFDSNDAVRDEPCAVDAGPMTSVTIGFSQQRVTIVVDIFKLPPRAKLLLRRLLYKRRPECELEEAAKQ
jgi:hypothetical protein